MGKVLLFGTYSLISSFLLTNQNDGFFDIPVENNLTLWLWVFFMVVGIILSINSELNDAKSGMSKFKSWKNIFKTIFISLLISVSFSLISYIAYISGHIGRFWLFLITISVSTLMPNVLSRIQNDKGERISEIVFDFLSKLPELIIQQLSNLGTKKIEESFEGNEYLDEEELNTEEDE